MIPDDAVEAAGEAIRDLWDSGDPVTPEMEARAALEAAAPHLMAKAWDEGYDEAEHEPIYHHSPKNPYRAKDDDRPQRPQCEQCNQGVPHTFHRATERGGK